MGARITCRQEIKKEISDFLLEEIGKRMESIKKGKYAVTVEETKDGLKVAYPIGEVSGFASDYVENIGYVFEDLKAKYSDISIYGIAYEYESNSAYTFGPLFYCKPEDTNLTKTFKWQICANCGTIVGGDAFYNSSQNDFNEGNLGCLCCPTCMLEYALGYNNKNILKNSVFTDHILDAVDYSYNFHWNLDVNGSFDDDERDEIYEDEDDYTPEFRNRLWKRIVDNLDAYMDDFRNNKDRIYKLTEKAKLSAEQKVVLLEITNRM